MASNLDLDFKQSKRGYTIGTNNGYLEIFPFGSRDVHSVHILILFLIADERLF